MTTFTHLHELATWKSNSPRQVAINLSMVVAMHKIAGGTRLRLSADPANSIDVAEDLLEIMEIAPAPKDKK